MKRRVIIPLLAAVVAALSYANLQDAPTFPAGPLVQKPWIQLGEQRAKGSVAVVWQGDGTERPFVLEFRQNGGYRAAKWTSRLVEMVSAPPHRVYSATLDRLRAGETINYRLRLGTETVFEGSTIAPKSDGQPYTFAVFGDCGIGQPQQAQVAAQIYAKRPDFAMITGDIVYNDGRINEYQRRFFPYYAADKADSAVGAPLLSSTLVIGVPGNHDILNNDLEKEPDAMAYFYYWKQPLNGPVTDVKERNATPLKGSEAGLQAFYRTAGPNFPRMANFSFDYGNAHWLCLDANPYVDWTDAKLRKWVLDDLKRTKKTWKFVAFHQPGFHSSREHQAEKQMRQAADLFEDGGVDIVFAGHVHNYQRSHPIQVGAKRGAVKTELERDDWAVDKGFDGRTNTRPKGVLYIVEGAGGARLYSTDLNMKPADWKPFQSQYIADYGFGLASVNGRRFELVNYDAAGGERDRFVVEK
jgi:hypothetical protein